MTAGEPGTSDWPDPRASAAERLRALHHGSQPLVLPNVWDPVSARVFAGAGFAALATSSGAVAETLGCADGQTPGDDMMAAVARIARAVDVPVTADAEDGYGLPPAQLADRLLSAGVAGCNLEDSDPRSRQLADPGRQADFLAAVRAAAGTELVINARVDVFVRPAPAGQPADPEAVIDAAVQRAAAYLAAGADCVYPIVAPAGALPELVTRIDGPVNAMVRPGGPSLAELAAFGVARISFGTGLHTLITDRIREMAAGLAADLAALPPA
jgi:2-methylisocitrate lyase-like PEP mutase family enzyme